MPDEERPKQPEARKQQQKAAHVEPPAEQAKDAAGAESRKKAKVTGDAYVNPDGDKAKKNTEQGQRSTLMPAAVQNLRIAQQYIDGTKFPIEHKLVSFHYGVALLADGRDDIEKRNLAKEYFTAAAGWKAEEGVSEEVAKAANRILCEARYNLGVIEELNQNYGLAREQYSRALDYAVGPFLAFRENAPSYSATELGNVAVLAHLGWISAAVADLRIEAKAKGEDEKTRDKFSDRVKFPIKQGAILRRQIKEFKDKAYAQESATGVIAQNGAKQATGPQPGRNIAVSYRHELLDTILRRADAFVLELYGLADITEEQEP